MRRNSVLLGLFATLATGLIAGVYLGTRERIAAERRKAEGRALHQIVPVERHDNQMLDDFIALGEDAPGLGLRGERRLYVARRGGEAVAVVIPATAPDGYAGDIDLAVGVNSDGSIAGVRVLAHRETPGLGDRVELKKSPWILGFDGRSLADPEPERWGVKKDRGAFDQFTGATITPRAVTAAVKRSLEYFRDQRGQLLRPAPASPAPAPEEPSHD